MHPCWESVISQVYFIFEPLKWLRELLLKRLLLAQKPSACWMDLVHKVAPCRSSTAVKQA